MVDFNKKFHNTSKFRQAALTFQKTGKYCAYPNNTQEYFAYWDQETDRCLNGYTADDGDWISGYNYFYLNYCPIQRIVNHIIERPDGTKIVTRKRELDFPDFWDYDVYFFEGVNDAETVGKHMCVLKSRRKGFSYKAASMCCRNYYLIPESKSYVYASNKQYLTEDGTLTKAWDYMNFIDKHTAWGKKRSVNTTMRKRAGFFSRDEYGNQIELGYKSEIIGVTLKDNPDIGHPYDEYVYTPTGKLCWEDVKVGTQLFHCNKDITTVKEVIELGDVDVYEFQLSDGRTVQSTLDHKWRIFRYRHKQKSWNGHNESREIRELVCTTKDILDMMKYKNYTNNPARIKLNLGVEFNEQKIPVDAYTLGLLIGDGCFKKTSKKGVAFTQLPEDMEDIKQYVPYDVIKCNTKRGIDWKILIPEAKNKISELGLLTTTAENKFVPDIYKYNSEEIRLAVLNGLLDTDGTISKDYGVIEFSSKSNTLAEDVCFLCRSLGINCKKSSKVINNYVYYRVYIYSRSKDFRLFKLARKNERLKLKNDSSFAESRRIWTKIVSAKYVGKKKSKCVHVDSNDEVYLINDFIETKNCRGKAAKLILFEEAGSFSELGAAWEIARPSVEVDSVAFGLMLAFGTGGDEDSNFETLRSMFYNPEGYNCIEFENIWDDIATKPCGFFCPQYTNIDIRDENGKRLYMDDDGNTLRDKAVAFLLEERRKMMENAKTSESIDRYVAERCLTPSEACLDFKGNIFPKKELQQQLARIRVDKVLKNAKQVGDLVFDANNQLQWIQKKVGDIDHYPLNKDDDPTGSIVIWEHPNKDASKGLYIAGIDSYDFDQSTTTSLGSCFIYKRFQNFEEYSDVIVAEYTGRPASANDFYENVRKLLLYYNATAMYENQNKGIFVYLSNKGYDYLLADQPDILLDQVGLNSTKVNRKKGCHMNQQIKTWAFGLIKDWLNELDDKGVKNLNKIMSEPFLEELIKCTEDSNVDRIMAFCQVMIYRQQLMTLQTKEEKEETKKRALFDGPLFTDSWFNYYSDQSFNGMPIDDVPTFTFNRT